MTIDQINGKICKINTSTGTKLDANCFSLFTGRANNGIEMPFEKLLLFNPKDALVFSSLTGRLYLDENMSQPVALNTKYAGITFYYDSRSTKPTGNYLYDYGSGINDTNFRTDCAICTKDFLTARYSDGSLTALLGTASLQYCWSVTTSSTFNYYRLDLRSGTWSSTMSGTPLPRCNSKSF